MVKIVITGNGAGKTTAAIGAAIRHLGHKHKVIIIQFMKGRKDTGEYKLLSKLKGLTIKQFGTKRFVKSPSENDIKLAQAGIAYAKDALKKKPQLIILDEINIAIRYNLVDEKQVLDLLNRAKSTDIILTGRYASKKIIRAADIVTEIKGLKMPRRFITKKGLTH